MDHNKIALQIFDHDLFRRSSINTTLAHRVVHPTEINWLTHKLFVKYINVISKWRFWQIPTSVSSLKCLKKVKKKYVAYVHNKKKLNMSQIKQ